MRVFLHEITDSDKDLHFTQEDRWVKDSIETLDEAYDGKPLRTKERTSSIDFRLRKVDEVVVVDGKIKTTVELCCSRCANPFLWPLNVPFSTLFCKDPVMAGMAHFETDQHGDVKTVGRNHGLAKSASSLSEGGDAKSEAMDITYLNEDFIDLAEVLKEQIQLQIPYQPLCREDCKGMCANCGADLNVGICPCSKIKKDSPFAVLEKIKLKN